MIRRLRHLRSILRRRRVWAGVFLLSLALSLVSESSAQPVDEDSLRQAAAEDYHGADLRGKDGPLSKAGMDLLLLYHRWTSGAVDRQGVSGSLQIQNGRVTVDAIAAGTAADLASDLKRLGAKNVATAGALVSGQIPISAIPDAARLPTLQSMRPSRPRTQSSGSGPGAVSGAIRVSPLDSAERGDPSASATESAPAQTDAAGPASRDAAPTSRPATDAAPDRTKQGPAEAPSDRVPDPTADASPDSSREGETPAQTGTRPGPEETASSAIPARSGTDETGDGAFFFLALLLVVTVFVSDEM
jgi:hypothetical protein